MAQLKKVVEYARSVRNHKDTETQRKAELFVPLRLCGYLQMFRRCSLYSRAHRGFQFFLRPEIHSKAKTYTAPPSGTSGNSPGKSRLRFACIPRESPPQPEWTAMYCFPSSMNDV